MAAPGFRAKPAVYDVLWIDTTPMPGEWDCAEIGRTLKLKTPKGSGDDGGAIRATGLEVTRGSITSKLHTDEDEFVWATLIEEILPVTKGKRKALPITHPQFARHGIKFIVVTHVSEGRPRAGDPIHVRLDWIVARDSSGKTSKPKKKIGPLKTPGSALALEDHQARLSRVRTPAEMRSVPPPRPEDVQSLPEGPRVLMSLPR